MRGDRNILLWIPQKTQTIFGHKSQGIRRRAETARKRKKHKYLSFIIWNDKWSDSVAIYTTERIDETTPKICSHLPFAAYLANTLYCYYGTTHTSNGIPADFLCNQIIQSHSNTIEILFRTILIATINLLANVYLNRWMWCCVRFQSNTLLRSFSIISYSFIHKNCRRRKIPSFELINKVHYTTKKKKTCINRTFFPCFQMVFQELNFAHIWQAEQREKQFMRCEALEFIARPTRARCGGLSDVWHVARDMLDVMQRLCHTLRTA